MQLCGRCQTMLPVVVAHASGIGPSPKEKYEYPMGFLQYQSGWEWKTDGFISPTKKVNVRIDAARKCISYPQYSMTESKVSCVLGVWSVHSIYFSPIQHSRASGLEFSPPGCPTFRSMLFGIRNTCSTESHKTIQILLLFIRHLGCVDPLEVFGHQVEYQMDGFAAVVFDGKDL